MYKWIQNKKKDKSNWQETNKQTNEQTNKKKKK